MTDCPTTGTWRTWIDGETSIVGPDEHLATCAGCAHSVAELRSAARFAEGRLTLLATPNNFVPREADPIHADAARTDSRGRNGWLNTLAVAAATALIVMTPMGQDAAQAFLSSFRVQRFDLIQASAIELIQVAETLGSLGSLDDSSALPMPSREPLTDAATTTGLDLDDMARLTGDEVILIPASSLRWTLDQDMVNQHLAKHRSSLDLPVGLDGTMVTVERAAAVIGLIEGADRPELVVGVSGPVTADATGMRLEDVCAFLLEVPGIPDAVTSQLGEIDDWQATLPLPIPVDDGSARQKVVDGLDVVEFTIDELGHGYLWTSGDQIVTVIAGNAERARAALAEYIR